MMGVTIFHNPACGTSRNALALIRHAGIEPVVIEYLKMPPSAEKLRELIAAMGISVRELLRQKGTPYAELGLDDPALSDERRTPSSLTSHLRSIIKLDILGHQEIRPIGAVRRQRPPQLLRRNATDPGAYVGRRVAARS